MFFNQVFLKILLLSVWIMNLSEDRKSIFIEGFITELKDIAENFMGEI